MKATVYYDADDIDVDEQVLKMHVDRQLKGMGLLADITVRPSDRLAGRRPLLVLDGGMLNTCPGN